MEETSEKTLLQRPQVFLSFRGAEVRQSFVSHLVKVLEENEVNVYVEAEELNRGDPLKSTFKVIEESRIALVIFSKRYTESLWCLDELVKIKERVEQGKLVVIPIFYELNPSQVEGLDGDFGINLWNHVKRTSEFDKLTKWKEALVYVSVRMGFVFTHPDRYLFYPLNLLEKVDVTSSSGSLSAFGKAFVLSIEQQQESYNLSTFIVEIVKHVKNEVSSYLLWSAKSDVNPKEDEVKFPGKLRRDDGLDLIKADSFIGETNSDATSKLQNSAEVENVDPVNEEKKQENENESSTMVAYDNPFSKHKVFINFRGAEGLRVFVSHLVMALKLKGASVYVEGGELRGSTFEQLFKRIEASTIALVIFSPRYTESKWCLDELVKIKELRDEGKILAIPIFYKVESSEVLNLNGEFGDNFWNLWRLNRDHHVIKWKEALNSVASGEDGFCWKEHSSERDLVNFVNDVQKAILKSERENPFFSPSTERKGENNETYLNLNKRHLFGMEQRMEQMEKKLEFVGNDTRIIGVVGMPGIGKTTLAMKLHEKWNRKFIRCVPLLGIRKKLEDHEPEWLRKTLLEVLLAGQSQVISDKTTHGSVKVELLKTKIFAVLDDVSDKKQLEFLLDDRDWIRKGSKIVITTCDKSLLEGFVHDTYVVPKLNDTEAFQLFSSHAFNDQLGSPTGTFLTLSRMFVDYGGGHPLALNILGRELCGKSKAHWKYKLETLKQKSNMVFQDVLGFSTDHLNESQEDAFLDIVCFFKSEDEYFVRSLLDSGDPDSTGAVSEVKDLVNKFLITISDNRVEMNVLLYYIAKDIGSSRWLRLWNYKDIINELKSMKTSEANNVRGIFLDMSMLMKRVYLDSSTFINMHNLRYLKIYDSSCPGQCEADCKLCFPFGLELPLKEVRYLHWVQFPLEKLPPDFIPKNLVDLRLPYSKLQRVWEGFKETPRLKWVDLSHSSKLRDLSALSKADKLQKLNLEGCTVLAVLPVEIQNMKSLVFLNLRGCIRLSYLPKMNLISLKTLILSDCSSLKEFRLISESVEFLHLDGTAIKGLPLAIQNLRRLIVLNLKNCKMLESLPNGLGELKALEELILSGCSNLQNLSDIRESMSHLQSLLMDRIGAKEMPNISCTTVSEGQVSADLVLQSFGPREWPRGVNGVCSLRRLCLSGNDFVSLQTDIGKFYSLNWLDVKQCRMLTSIPMLPPKLQYFDAYGCDSLERVANPLALQVLSEQNHATFNFSNCNKLDQDAKESIISYTRKKSLLVLDALSRYNGGSILEDFTGTCFPGWEVPAWFSHQASGSLLKPKLPPHWFDDKITGIGLCAVILFPTYHGQRNRVLVRCNCEFKNEEGSTIRFSCSVGGWSDPINTPRKINSSHVFIGFTSMMDNKKHSEEEDEEKCNHTEASIEFQVTDGTEVLEGYEVLNCGFSVVYATNEMENISWDARTDVNPETVENILGEETSYGNSWSHDEILYQSYSGVILDNDEKFFSEGKSDASPSIQKNFEDKRVDVLNEESDAGKESILSSYHDNKSSGNLEMHRMRSLAELEFKLKKMSKDLGSSERHKLWNYKDIIDKLTNMEQPEANNVRSIFLDMSEITESIALEYMTFTDMRNLLYLKIYNSSCPWHCKAESKLYFPDGLEFPLEEIRYLHWVKFPLEELPPDFKPENLVDLRLPYSKLERVWEGIQDIPWLKWVDLSHSSKLLDLSALSRAENLQRLNLEGCTSLNELPLEIQNMKSLVLLNLRGCIRLSYLPKMNLISLKTLILSDCANLKEFQLISESVEFLHLDGTSIKGLPPAIQKLKRLFVLNLKNCRMLKCLPNCLGEMKTVEVLILSGCSSLKNLSDVRESMQHLQSLLLDRIGAKEMSNISCVNKFEDQASADIFVEPIGQRKWPLDVSKVFSLQRLSLSGNDFVSLQTDIGQLYNLKWLDMTQCKNLRFVPTLPPRIQYFDAHGCDSLERVANPLAFPVLPDQIHATFNFSNCNKLDQDAKDSIMSYTRRRSQLVLDELRRYDGGLVLEVLIGTCFPGWEVPAWFSHRARGSVLKLKLPPHWCDNKFTGIGVCAVIVFNGCHNQTKRVLVKCNCEFKNEDGSSTRFSCTVGGWSEPSNTPRKIESSHVFIGFTSRLDIKKHSEEEEEEKCVCTETSIEFQVTDGAEEIKGCEVVKCGFSFVYAPDERMNTNRAIPRLSEAS